MQWSQEDELELAQLKQQASAEEDVNEPSQDTFRVDSDGGFSVEDEAELANLKRQEARESDALPIKEEMHSDVALSDRAIIKNFSNDPMASAQFLIKRYPNHDI